MFPLVVEKACLHGPKTLSRSKAFRFLNSSLSRIVKLVEKEVAELFERIDFFVVSIVGCSSCRTTPIYLDRFEGVVIHARFDPL